MNHMLLRLARHVRPGFALPPRPVTAAALAALLACCSTASAQNAALDIAPNVVVPQRGSLIAREGARRVALQRVDVDIEIQDRVAVTTLLVSMVNPTSSPLQVELLIPVPPGAAISGFDFSGRAPESTATVLPAQQARVRYEQVVQVAKDPALLEFADYDSVRTSVFPVPANAQQKVKVVYTNVLAQDGDRADYVLPRSESLASSAVPWTVRVHIRCAKPIAAIYSPTHAFERRRSSPTEAHLILSEIAASDPGPIQFSYLQKGDGVNATLFSHPDSRVGGGYLMLLAGVPQKPEGVRPPRREIIIVLDRSSSMRREKIEQARDAASKILRGLAEDEYFNVISFSNDVTQFATRPVIANAKNLGAALTYVDNVQAQGGTDIDSALGHALTQDHVTGTHSIVLFLTDGVPTDGVIGEGNNSERAALVNRNERRIYTFGLGDDVNAPLLDQLAIESRGRSTYVRPNEDVAQRVEEVYRKLTGPSLASATLKVLDRNGEPAPRRVADLEPAQLPDLYDGDQLVVLGTYKGDDPLIFEVSGKFMGETRTFRFPFRVGRDAREAGGSDTSFVPRLWASRRVATLLDAIRMLGEDPGGSPDKRKESDLARAIYKVSTEHGILTEYTAFLAREGTDLSRETDNITRLQERLKNDLRAQRSGAGAVRQAVNADRLRNQEQLNRRNARLDASFQEVVDGDVAQIGDRTFYRRGRCWIDARLMRRVIGQEPDATLRSGDPRLRALLAERMRGNPNALYALGADVLLEVDGKAIFLALADFSSTAQK